VISYEENQVIMPGGTLSGQLDTLIKRFMLGYAVCLAWQEAMTF